MDKGFKTDLLVIKEGKHKDAEMYIKAIKKGAAERNKEVCVLDLNDGVESEYINTMLKGCRGFIVANPIENKAQIWDKAIHFTNKDIDNFTSISSFKNCTVKVVESILNKEYKGLEYKDITVIGRNLGKDIANALENMNATVTLCHSLTKDLSYHTQGADVVITCAKAGLKLLNTNMIQDNALVIDIGWNIEGDFKNKLYTASEVGKMNIDNIFKHLDKVVQY